MSLDEFSAEFSRAWSRTESRFRKLECWQAYREAEATTSQVAYESGDTEGARKLLEREAQADRPLYGDVEARGLDYVRIRLLQEPLTPYLEYELLSYRVRVEMGENIEIVRVDSSVKLPSEECFDFLLFDRHTALIHDYGTGGVGSQTGGWLTKNFAVLDFLDAKVAALSVISRSFNICLGFATGESF